MMNMHRRFCKYNESILQLDKNIEQDAVSHAIKFVCYKLQNIRIHVGPMIIIMIIIYSQVTGENLDFEIN